MQWRNQYYKNRFPLNSGSGDGNVFRFFVENNLSLLCPGGSLCYVLPTALMMEEGSQTLRQYLLEHCQIKQFFSYENREGLFPDIDSRYKFAQLHVLLAPPLADSSIDTAFYLLQPAQLNDPSSHIVYPLRTLKTLSPQQWALMELRQAQDLPLLERCYRAFAPLSPQWLDFRNELHMTADKHLFHEQAAAGRWPLLEGKAIWHYSHQLARPQYWLEPAQLEQHLRSKELYRMSQDLGLSRAECERRFSSAVVFDHHFYRLAFRNIASDTNERSLVCGLVPPQVTAGHSLSLSSPKCYVLNAEGAIELLPTSSGRLLLALALLNSLVLDWITRFMVQINISKTYVMRLPLPQPSDAELPTHPIYAELVRHALLLSWADHPAAFEALAATTAASMGWPLEQLRSQLPTTDKQHSQLRLNNDVLVARLYGLSAPELGHISTGFTVLAKKHPEYLAALRDMA